METELEDLLVCLYESTVQAADDLQDQKDLT